MLTAKEYWKKNSKSPIEYIIKYLVSFRKNVKFNGMLWRHVAIEFGKRNQKTGNWYTIRFGYWNSGTNCPEEIEKSFTEDEVREYAAANHLDFEVPEGDFELV